MDNVSKILAAIHEDGAAEADKILSAGKKNADELKKLYHEDAATQEAGVLASANKKADEITQRSISQAGISSRNARLTARRNALEKAFSLASERLVQLHDQKKFDMYVGLIGKYSSSKDVTVYLNEKDKNAFGSRLVDEVGKKYNIVVTLSPISGDFSGGLVMEEGSVEINCTFEVLSEEFRKEAEPEIAAVLFEK